MRQIEIQKKTKQLPQASMENNLFCAHESQSGTTTSCIFNKYKMKEK